MTITDDELLARFPRARIDHDNKNQYKGFLEKKLLINRCAACGAWHQSPKPVCPVCWSTDVVPTAVSGRGTIHLLILLHQGPAASGVDYSKPYPVATVELEEAKGLRYTSTLVNATLEQLRVGLPVRLTWLDREGNPFPAFEPDLSR